MIVHFVISAFSAILKYFPLTGAIVIRDSFIYIKSIFRNRRKPFFHCNILIKYSFLFRNVSGNNA